MKELNDLYKVLWVEDDSSIIESYQMVAENYGLNLDVAANWEIAEEKLRINFNEYSAIILDAMCKIKKTDSIPSKLFLGYASVRLSRIFGEHHKLIPWYVLSAGTMDDFGVVLEIINTEERKSLNSLWGPMRYIKGGDDDECLFKKIQEVASMTEINTVLFRHSDVFKYLGEDYSIGYIKARTYILKMLSSLYYPEDNLNFIYEGNPLRKVLEYLFRTAHKYGLLPDDCLVSEKNRGVNLMDSNRFLSGLNPHHSSMRYGKAGSQEDGSDGDAVFTKEIYYIIKQISHFANQDSHTNEDDPYILNENKKELFFGSVLHLCHVIKFFGEFLEEHPNKENNLKMLQPNPAREQKTNFNNKKSITVLKKEILDPKLLIGQTKTIIMMSPGCVTWGDVCLVAEEYKTLIGKKAILKEVRKVLDTGSPYEYEAISLEILE